MNVSANTKNKALSLTQQQIEERCRLGIDSHADMTCIGAHAKILEVYEGIIVITISTAISAVVAIAVIVVLK